jgi:hypothetical protein
VHAIVLSLERRTMATLSHRRHLTTLPHEPFRLASYDIIYGLWRL